MNGQWNWLIGRKLSLGEVVDVFGESELTAVFGGLTFEEERNALAA